MHNKKSLKGFTIIETIITISLAGIIISILAAIINGGMAGWLFLRGQKDFLYQTESAVNRIEKDLIKTNGSSSTDILVFGTEECQVKTYDNETIDYRKNGTNLERNNIVILDNLPPDGLAFTYLGNDGAAATNQLDIRSIRFEVVQQKGRNRLRLMGEASIRNR